MKQYRIELCSENVFDVIKHQDKIDQVEFCSNLAEDGLTPDINDVKTLLHSFFKPIKVMIRCRPGNFEYSESEMNEMFKEIDEFKNIGINRFVFGAVKDNRLDIELIKVFAEYIYPSKLCIHKAIDTSTQIMEDVVLLKQFENINEILTSGGKITAEDAKEEIKEMISFAGENIKIIPAGKITYENIKQISESLNAEIYHGKNIVNIKI